MLNSGPRRFFAATLLALVLVSSGIAPAGAATLYENENFEYWNYQGSTNSDIGDAGDRASSLRVYNIFFTFYEDVGFRGRTLPTRADYNSLHRKSLQGGYPHENWADRISSLER